MIYNLKLEGSSSSELYNNYTNSAQIQIISGDSPLLADKKYRFWK